MAIGPLQVLPSTGGTAPNPVDVLGSLQEFRFGDFDAGFPVTQTSMRVRQDLTIHKFADRDGAHVEGCGRHPIEITARIAFINGLVPGKQETWDPNNLYPGAYLQFMKSVLSRYSQPLQHPEHGLLTVKIQDCKVDWEGKSRGGVFVDATWLETDDTATELVTSLGSQAPNSTAVSAATDLDSNIPIAFADYPGLSVLMKTSFNPPTDAAGEGTFTQLTNTALQGLTTASQYEWEVQGALSSVIYQATALENAVNLVQTGLPGQQPQCLLWPLVQSAELAKDSAYTLQQQMLNRQPAINIYTTTVDSTLGQVANILQADISDLLQLNVGLASMNFVPVGTSVKYYAVQN